MLPTDKILARKTLKPFFLPTPFWIVHRVGCSTWTQQFNLQGNAFTALADEESFKALQTALLEIEISQEINLLNEEHFLEITVPVLDFTDLFNQSFIQPAQKFACVVGVNGYGAKSLKDPENFSRPDYLLVTDILGNQFEILVQPDGKIELPQEGMGRFSLIRAITYVYSEAQIRQGRGLQNLTQCHVKENALYLLPPVDTIENFSVQICITTLNQGQRRVESIRTVNVAFKDNYFLNNEVSAKKVNEDPSLLYIETAVSVTKPCLATMTLDSPEMNYQESETFLPTLNGWMQHPIYPTVYSKRFGLSEKTLIHLFRQLYSQYDVMKDYLQGDTFGLSQINAYNNFLLRPESLEVFYDLLIHHVVRYKNGNFIWDRLPAERFTEVDLVNLPVDFHDSIVLAQLQDEIAENKLEHFKNLFTGYRHLQQEQFFLKVQANSSEIPTVKMEVFYDVHFLEDRLKADKEASAQALLEKNAFANTLRLPSIDLGE